MVSAVVRFQVEGFHRWATASGKRAYLAHPHRHLFHVEVRVEVFHNDRDVEFHDLLEFCRERMGAGDFGGDSCEALAQRLGQQVVTRWPGRAVQVAVFEDGEMGAQVLLGGHDFALKGDNNRAAVVQGVHVPGLVDFAVLNTVSINRIQNNFVRLLKGVNHGFALLGGCLLMFKVSNKFAVKSRATGKKPLESQGIETIPNSALVNRVEYTPGFGMVSCSVGKQPFAGSMEITYRPGETLVEFESFERWLKSISSRPMTIEDLCRLTFDSLRKALGNIPLRVVVDARTTVHAPVRATIESDGFQ